MEIVSAGGTGTYSISGRIPGVTEIQGGSYLLMDTDYQTVCPDFDLALSVLGTVISRSGNERLILDIGLKEISGERGLPVLKNADGARLRRLNAEHAIVDIVDPNLSRAGRRPVGDLGPLQRCHRQSPSPYVRHARWTSGRDISLRELRT